MNQQENETVDYLISEETADQDFFAFADRGLTDEQLAEVKGGPGGVRSAESSRALRYENDRQRRVGRDR